MHDIKNRVKKLITEDILTDLTIPEITDEMSIINDLHFDSIQLLQFIASLEKEFDILFSGEDLSLDSFENIGTITELIERMKQ